MNSRTKNFYWLFAAIAMFVVVFPLFWQGMFLDGQQYAAVAMNLADGKGTFWHPYLTATWGYFGETAFMEQPPFGFSLQSIAFSLLGNGASTERFYNLLLFVLSCVLLLQLWKEVKQKDAWNQGWFPLLLFISIGTTAWVFHNNVWEVQLSIFCGYSVLFTLKAFNSSNNIKLASFSFLAGLFIVLAVMTKGVPGLFPLAAPFGLILVSRKREIIAIQTLVISTVILGFFILYNSSTEATEAIDYYINKRLLQRVNSQPTVDSHFHILSDLFSQLIPVFALTALPILFKKKLDLGKNKHPYTLFFIYVGLTATLPLMLTLIQRGFYLYPGYFYFVIAAALIAGNAWQEIEQSISDKATIWIGNISMLLCPIAIALTITFSQKLGRDADLLADVKSIKEVVPAGSTLKYNTYGKGEAYNVSLYMYLVRFSEIEPSMKSALPPTEYVLQNMGEKPLPGYSALDLNLSAFTLYKKTE
jgi:4-amino-4-deoxy-L-arabinose transferase-like glycosyltransferase